MEMDSVLMETRDPPGASAARTVHSFSDLTGQYCLICDS